MRWIRYILVAVVAIVLIAVLVLLALGGGRGESRLVRSIEIAKPPHVVFAWITEPVRLKIWVGWLIDVQPLTSTPDRVGAKQLWVMEDRNNNNQRMEIHSEVARYERDRLFEARVTAAEGFTGTVTYELQPIDAHRTHLTYRGTYHFEHWLAKLLEPVISRSAQQKLSDDLERLKQKAEAE